MFLNIAQKEEDCTIQAIQKESKEGQSQREGKC